MTLRVGTATQIERHPRDLAGTVPVEAYLMLSGGLYVPGIGSKATEAVAFLKDMGSDLFTLDDSLAEEDRQLYHVGTTEVLV